MKLKYMNENNSLIIMEIKRSEQKIPAETNLLEYDFTQLDPNQKLDFGLRKIVLRSQSYKK
jgi:hypothetical protein